MRFSILGPLEVIRDGRALALGGAKQRSLIAILILHANEQVSSDSLIEELWRDSPPATAGKTLQTYISHLRKLLEPERVAGEPWRLLLTVHSSYSLRVEPDQLDSLRFERLVRDARTAIASRNHDRGRVKLETALGLWRGPVLGDMASEPFARSEAARLEALRLSALELRVATDLELGRHAEIAPEIEEAVRTYPFREGFTGHLMVALYRSGRQADALSAFQRLREALVDELGIEPSPDLQDLYQRVLRQDPALRPPESSTAAASPRPSGGIGDADARPRVAGGLPLVGRDRELEMLRAQWNLARGGTFRFATIGGEPGIGKSRLAREVVVLARDEGATVLVGHCAEEPLLPYQPFVEALRENPEVIEMVDLPTPTGRDRLLRLIPDSMDGSESLDPSDEDHELSRYQLFDAVTSMFTAASQRTPLLVVLEDLHWVDKATFALLNHVARVPDIPLLILGTYRQSDVSDRHPVARLLSDLHASRRLEHIALESLDAKSIARMTSLIVSGEPRSKFVEALTDMTDGNPFYIEELLRHLIDTGALDPSGDLWPDSESLEEAGIPHSVRVIIRRRLLRLSDSASDVLAQGSVLGRQFDFHMLGGLAGMEEELIPVVEEAVSAGLLIEKKTTWAANYAFSHALVRRTLYDGLSQPRRQRLHLRAAELIEASAEPGFGTISAAAAHIHLAGSAAENDVAIPRLMAASEAASSVYAWDDAIAHLRLVLERLRRSGAPREDRAALAERIGALTYATGAEYELGLACLREALDHFEAIGDERSAARVHSRLGLQLATYPTVMDIPAALSHYHAAKDVLGEDESVTAGYLYLGMAIAAVFALETRSIGAASARAVELAETIGNEQLVQSTEYSRCWYLFNQGRLAESFGLNDRIWERARRLDNTRTAAWCAFGRSIWSGIYLANPIEAEAWCTRGLALPDLTAFSRQHKNLLDRKGEVYGTRGDLARARESLADVGENSVVERLVHFWDGEWERAERAWADAEAADLRAGNRLEAALNCYWLGRVRRVGDRPEAGLDALQRGLTMALDGPQVPLELMLRTEIAEACLDMRQLDDARSHLNRCREILATGEDWGGRAGQVSLAEARLRSLDDRGPEADRDFAEAIELLTRWSLVWEEAEGHLGWARALIEAGRAGESREHIAIVKDTYLRIDAGTRWSERATAAGDPQGSISTTL
ncbi:MAG: AAA family ATPase [Actinobacteria bacterium]|nr:AAA family ATPase [Actinomycetota bacterium]